MRLLIITEGYYPYTGGLEKIVTEVAEGLQASKKYEVQVVTSTKTDKESNEIIHGVNVTYLPLNRVHGKIRFALGDNKCPAQIKADSGKQILTLFQSNIWGTLLQFLVV